MPCIDDIYPICIVYNIVYVYYSHVVYKAIYMLY